MRLFNFMILFFLLAAFTIGIALENNGTDKLLFDNALENITLVIDDITLVAPNDTKIPNVDGLYSVIEKYIKFIGSLAIETMRAGVHFGYDNPDYFTPEFIIKIMQLIVFLIIVSLLIKPLGYVIVFLVMLFIMLIEKLKKRRRERLTKLK